MTKVNTAAPHEEDWIEVWFPIEKDADGYPETKSWEGLWAAPDKDGTYVLQSVPFYLKNVSRGDRIAVNDGELRSFDDVVERGGHNTYRLLLPRGLAGEPASTMSELEAKGLTVEEEHGFFLAVDVPPSVDQEEIDRYLCAQSESGRWEMQDGFLAGAMPDSPEQ